MTKRIILIFVTYRFVDDLTGINHNIEPPTSVFSVDSESDIKKIIDKLHFKDITNIRIERYMTNHIPISQVTMTQEQVQSIRQKELLI